MSEETKKIVVGKEIMDELKRMNEQNSKLHVKLGGVRRDIIQMQEQEKGVYDSIVDLEGRIQSMIQTVFKSHGLSSKFSWKMDFATGELLQVEKVK